jgi:RND family efflux transporter MFP subunit
MSDSQEKSPESAASESRKPRNTLGRRARKILLPVVILVVAVSFAGYLRATRPPIKRSPIEERVWVVSAMPVSFQDIQPKLRLYGEVVAGRKVDLRPLVGGRIVAVGPDFATGGIVRTGDLLIEIDDFDYKSTLAEREAQLAEAKARLEEYLSDLTAEKQLLVRDKEQLKLREREVQRRANLRARGSGSVKALDDARLALNQARQAVTAREQGIARLSARTKQQSAVLVRMKVALERARRDLQEVRLRAPFDGFLIDVEGAIGKKVTTNDRVARLIDARWLEAKFQISDEEFGRLVAAGGYMGRKATVRWATRGRTFTFPAVIKRSASQVDANSGGVDLFARIANTDAKTVLRPGVFVEVVIEDRAYSKVVRLPASALHGGNRVYAVVDGRLRERRVELVARAGNDVLVRGPLKSDERILTTRFAEVGAGVRVEVR